jgi:holo-[acyl-carrier protein] synthase
MIIGIGVDLVEISRVRSLIASQGERAVLRLFTESERRYCGDMANPARHYAVRVAAKEAAFKALGTGWARGVQWKDVEVERLASGQPILHLHGAALGEAEKLGATRFFVSLTHDQLVSAAVVVLESGDR